jgi:hypothetical protein
MPLIRITLAIALAALLAAPAADAQSCQPIQISWPADARVPVWELTALPVSLSSGPSGSGLEIRDVKYRGISVLKRGHVPMLNVRYESGCNCFRDWMTSNTRFDATNVTGTCFAEPPAGTSRTVCEMGIGVGDVGTFQGIAMEDFGDGFSLITQSQAGWYRYRMSWTFEVDGTIRPEFGFSHTPSGCAENPRRHYAYWRLDFAVEDAERNWVAASHNGSNWTAVRTEQTQNWIPLEEALAPSRWAVFHTESRRGYSITAGEKEYLTPANPGTGNPLFDEFANEDIAFSRYRAGQFRDSVTGCAVNYTGGSNPIIQGESIEDTDVVLWWRTGATRQGGNGNNTEDVCEPLGPVLQPIGDWGYTPTDSQPLDAEPGGRAAAATGRTRPPPPSPRRWGQRVQDADRRGVVGQHLREPLVAVRALVGPGPAELHAERLDPRPHHLPA